MAKEMIRIEKLRKEFDTERGKLEVLKGVDLKINKGEIFGIIGLSGAGKSTLVRCINRLEEPTSGKIFVNGEDILDLGFNELNQLRRSIGMIFQHFNLFDQKTVSENIAYPLEIAAYPAGDIEKRVDQLVKFIDLEDRKYSYPSQLSGGQKQRVAIARALANRPKILLSDEGTSALDPANTQVILKLLEKAAKEMDLTIVMITHQMEVAKQICDRIAVMEDGRIIEENTVDELFRNPKTKRTLSFIEGLQTGDVRKVDPSDIEGVLVRLTFDEDTAGEPVIARLVKDLGVEVNILSGNINKLRESKVGYLNLELNGDDEKIKKALARLSSEGVNVEVAK